ncbi:MAG: VWA domain-containing protein [Gemmatimonadota bacterium]
MVAVRFADPLWLWALLLLPLLVYRYVSEERGERASVRFSDLELLGQPRAGLGSRLRHGLLALRVLGMGCLVLAMARPQAGKEVLDLSAEGVDIMLVLDVSGSMEARDLGPTSRLEVAKEVVAEFIGGRQTDRIGMVVFAAESYTQCPLTLDYDVLLSFLGDIRIADKSWDGTAIGMALVTACNRLRDSEAKSKVVILLTDGVNNAGEIDPQTASEAAAALGIRVYTIGVGSGAAGLAAVLRGRPGGPAEFDEATLKDIAARTGGQYYHATSREKLEAIYQEIGQLETTEVSSDIHVDYAERYGLLLWLGLLLLLGDFALANSRFRRIP